MTGSLDDDPELLALLAEQHRLRVRRAVRMSLAALAMSGVGAVLVAYGRYLDAAQAGSELHFYFPSRLQWVGFLLVGVGGIAAVAFLAVAGWMHARRGL